MHKVIDGRWGRAKYFAKDEYVGRSLHNYGEYNPDETEMILSLADKTKLSLDIGANIGCISQALVASGHEVYAFEPQPDVYDVLCENLSGNSHVHNCALGNSTGTVLMPKVHYSEKGNFGGLSCNTKSHLGSYDVPLSTMDSFGFENVGFIKIDVEGWELEVLKGGYETIMRDRPIMYIEDDRVEKRSALRAYIRDVLNYSIEEHYPTLYRENNFFGLKKNIWGNNYTSHNLIARPC